MTWDKLTQYLDSLSQVGVPGCDMTVWRDHQPIYRHMAGYSDENASVPMNGRETYCLYSCTKLFTTCAAMQLIEQGKMTLDTPVSEFLPAYAHLTVEEGGTIRPARRVMTIRHLMSMQGGMDYDLSSQPIREALAAAGGQVTTRQLVDAMARKPLHFEPGENYQYSLCHDVLAAVIEVASGKKFSQYLREHIFEPLGMKTLSFQFTPEITSRLCAQYLYHADTKETELRPRNEMNYRLSPNYESGGAGLIGDVDDYILLADALACGGKGRTGAHILSPAMIQLWRANQLGPQSRKTFDTNIRRAGYSYALGVRTRVDTSVGGRGPLGEFGWDGAAGAWVMIDPASHVSAFYAQHVRGFGYAYDVIHPTLRSLIFEALEL